jgi:drug/metabolite transporter (DMT)-like permease
MILGPAALALTGDWTGYGAALLCAGLWSGYSVLSRYVGDAPTDSVAGFCLGAAALAGLCHLALEETVPPRDALAWASVLGLGLGPVGAAFYVWDIGCKRGDLQLLGVLAYAAPLLSTLILVVAGFARESDPVLLGGAALMIIAGSLIAARASIGRSAAGSRSGSGTGAGAAETSDHPRAAASDNA